MSINLRRIGNWAVFLAVLSGVVLLAVPHVPAQYIAAAEYYINTDPGKGNGTPVNAADGVFDATNETLDLRNIETSHLTPGYHYLHVRAQDDQGRWGNVFRTMFEVRDLSRSLQSAHYRINGGDWHPLLFDSESVPGQVLLQSDDIDTTGLSEGRHLVEVVLYDSHGTPSRIWQSALNVYKDLSVAGTEFQITYQNSYTEGGHWIASQSVDGAFDSREEEFEAEVESDEYISQERYFVWARSIDSRGRRSEPRRVAVETGNEIHVNFDTDGTRGATLTGETFQVFSASGGDCTPIEAIASDDYSFQHWALNGEVYSVDNPLTVNNVTEIMNLIAVFALPDTPTPTSTDTFTPTYTPSDTPSSTTTWTHTHTPTLTPTSTTLTPTATDSPTNTPTDIPTSTPTSTDTFTPTYTPSDTPSDTPTLTQTNTPTAPSTSELLGEWLLDEGSGTVAYDTSGNGYHGTLISDSGAPTWGPGYLHFECNDDAVACIEVPDFPNVSGSMSVHARFRVEAATPGSPPVPAIVSKWDPYSENCSWQMSVITATLGLEWGGDWRPHPDDLARALSPDGSVVPGQWHTAVGVFRANEANEIYIDRILSGTHSHSQSSFRSTSSPLRIGNRHWLGSNWNPFYGDIDYVQIWSGVKIDPEQFDTPTNTRTNTPSPSPTSTPAVQVGSIVAWGSNFSGESNVPEPNENFIKIAAAGEANCLGLKADGSVVAWGRNLYGACDVPSPNSGFKEISAGMDFSLGIKSDGSIVAWGWNGFGQLNVPAPNTAFKAVSGGERHALGLRASGSVAAWGDNRHGQLYVPFPNSNFTKISAGGVHSLGLKENGSVVAWGASSYNYGQCDVPSPNSDFVAISAGEIHSLGLKRDGSIVAWGDNTLGQCDVPSPNSDFVAISAGAVHSLGLKRDGSIVAWGYNTHEQCNVPTPNSHFIAMAASWNHSLGLRSVVEQPTETPTATPTEINEPPTLESVYLTPDPGRVDQPLTAVPIGFHDPEGAAPAYRYQWYVNGVEVAGQNVDVLQPSFFAAGNLVSVLVYPFDGSLYGEPRSASVRISSPQFRLYAVPGELTIPIGGSSKYVIRAVADTAQNMSVALELGEGNTDGIRAEFHPSRIDLTAAQQSGFAELTIEVLNYAVAGVRTLTIRGMSGFWEDEITVILIILPKQLPQSILTLNVAPTQVDVAESIRVYGDLLPAVVGAPISIRLRGDFSMDVTTWTDAHGHYEARLQISNAGTVQVQAFAAEQSAQSRQVSVTVGRFTRVQIILKTTATGEELIGDTVNIFGELTAFGLDETSPPVELDITQNPPASKSGILAGTEIHNTLLVPVAADGTFSASVEVTVDNAKMEVLASWEGDAKNLPATSEPMYVLLRGSRLDQRVLLVFGEPIESSGDTSLTPLMQFAEQTFQGRGITGDRLVTLHQQKDGWESISAALDSIYMADQKLLLITGRGTPEGIVLTDGSILTPEILTDAIRDVTGTLVVVLDADNAGIFDSPLLSNVQDGTRRVFITSTRNEDAALLTNGGLISFSSAFIRGIRQSKSVMGSYGYSATELQLMAGLTAQTPNLASVSTDPSRIIFGTALGDNDTDLTAPIILDLGVPESARFLASLQITTRLLERSDIHSVATNYLTGKTQTEFEQVLTLMSGSTDVYVSAALLLSETGTWTFSVIATDAAGNISEPARATCSVVFNETLGSAELLIIAGEMGNPQSLIDLTGDGILNLDDILAFIGGWHSQRPRVMPTPTQTPTMTPTPTFTNTPTAMPTETPTITPTFTSTPTRTSTMTSTMTPTTTDTPTATPTPSDTPTQTPTPLSIILDNADATVVASGGWMLVGSPEMQYGTNYLTADRGDGSETVRYRFDVETAGQYGLYEWHPQVYNAVYDARVLIEHNGGQTEFVVNQRAPERSGKWNHLGSFDFSAGTHDLTISNKATNGILVISDAFMLQIEVY